MTRLLALLLLTTMTALPSVAESLAAEGEVLAALRDMLPDVRPYGT